MLPFAIKSVLAQTELDFELCILCDGAPPETAMVARDFARDDPRVLVFAFPKGERYGEAQRAAVLGGAQSTFVTHIGDDDLYLPDYLRQLADLLSEADFVSVPRFAVKPDGCLHVCSFGDLGHARFRRRMLTRRWNFVGPTEAAYRLTAYRSLAEGWSPGPKDVWSGLHMWRKFPRHPGLRLKSGFGLGTLKFVSPDWQHLTLSQRRAANEVAWRRLQDPDVVAALQRDPTVLLAHAIKLQHLLRYSITNPRRYLPTVAYRLLRSRPDIRVVSRSAPAAEVPGDAHPEPRAVTLP
jgi:glycosyltransferase involved in cell wall biosynthesis